MSTLTILSYPDERLRLKAVPVEDFGASLALLANDMAETMYRYSGIGLAATQVNVQKRVVVLDISEKKDQLVVLVNPRVLNGEGLSSYREGCLSVPGIFEYVERPATVLLEYYNLKGKRISCTVDGLFATCIQHEIDHLDGKIFIDYLDGDLRLKIDNYFSEKNVQNA